MQVKPYPKYKLSGVEWLGEMPEHWVMASLRWVSRRYAGGTPDRSNDAYWDEGDIPWINSGAVNQSFIREPSSFITYEGFINSSAKWIPRGALVMALAGQGKTKGMVAQLGIDTTCNQSMAAIVPDGRIVPRFLFWWLTAQYDVIRNLAGGEQRDGLNLDILGSLPVVLFPEDEQRVIAGYLDRETARIDTLVAKKRELIEKLKEKRVVRISHTVTRGLPPDAACAAGLDANPKLKPSGIESLGDMLRHWDVLPFTKYLVDRADYRGKTPEKVTNGVFLVTARNVRMGYIDYESSREYVAEDEYDEIMRRGLPKKGDILFTTEAPLGNVALVDREDVALAQRIIRFRVNPKHLDSRFTLYAMMSDYFQNQLQSLSTGSTAEGLKASKLPILRIVAAPCQEQRVIGEYLDREAAKIGALTEKVHAAIQRLQEYRAALITAAVTGKIDVRGIAGELAVSTLDESRTTLPI